MPEPLTSWPMGQVPGDTARAASSAGDSDARLLAIGDELIAAARDLDLSGLHGIASDTGGVRLGMVTLLQYDRGLSDAQAVEATRTRPDWKYALHLPLEHPGLMSDDLADFRARLQRSASGRQALNALQERLARYGVCESASACRDMAAQVIVSVEALNALHNATNVMRMALEALAALYGDWLRTISLSHWYGRYTVQPAEGAPLAREGAPAAREEALHALASAAEDIAHLLRAVESDRTHDLAALPEVAALRAWQRNWQSRVMPHATAEPGDAQSS